MMNGELGRQQPQQQPQQVDGNIPVPITMTINTWNAVLGMIVKQPWEQADPLVREIHKQIQDHLVEKGVIQPMPPSATNPTQVA